MTATGEAVFSPLRRKNYCSAEKKYFLCAAIKSLRGLRSLRSLRQIANIL
jgi:hypothetical protein